MKLASNFSLAILALLSLSGAIALPQQSGRDHGVLVLRQDNTKCDRKPKMPGIQRRTSDLGNEIEHEAPKLAKRANLEGVCAAIWLLFVSPTKIPP